MLTCPIHCILCIFNQFAKRNETFIIRLINTGGTSGQNLTRQRHVVKIINLRKKSFGILIEYICICVKKENMFPFIFSISHCSVADSRGGGRRGGIPLPHPPPAALRADLVTPPAAVDHLDPPLFSLFIVSF